MGAASFINLGQGDTPSEAFRNVREEALHENGYGGYSGTIAEKDSFEMVEFTGTREELEAFIEEKTNTDFYDKWGPCGCIHRDSNNYVFFGWASS